MVCPRCLWEVCSRSHRIRFVVRLQSTLAIRLIAHLEVECTTIGQRGVRNIEFVIRLTIDTKALHVPTLVAHPIGTNGDGVAIGKCHAKIGQIGSAEDILIATGTNRIEAHGREDVPGRHLSAVVISAQATNIVAIHAVHDGTYPLLGLPRLTRPRKEVRYVMTGLIAMNVSSHQTVGRDILVVGVILWGQIHAEEFIQTLAEFGFASHLRHQAHDIVRNMKGEVPGISFNKTFVVGLVGIHPFLEFPIAVSRAGKTRVRVVHVAIRQGSPSELIGNILFACCQSCGIDGPIIVSIFQRVRCRRCIMIIGCISQHSVVVQSRHALTAGRRQHGFNGCVAIDFCSLGEGIRQDAYGVIARHAPALIPHQTPYGQQVVYALPVMRQHRLHHIGIAFGFEQHQQGV